MNSDIKGCSSCKQGEENHEKFKSGGRTLVQYDYRHTNGKLFTTIAANLEAARAKRDEWLKKQEVYA